MWVHFMEADRANSHCMLFDSSLALLLIIFTVLMFCFVLFLSFLCFMPFFSTLLFECSEPDPGFLEINNKCFKAFCTLARCHYLEICWHLI